MTAGQPRTDSTGSDPTAGRKVAEEEPLPSLTEQMAEQLGGWRGMVESSVPVVVFVTVNIITELRPAVIASVSIAVLIAAVRLFQRRPVRHAVNGLVGIGIGAMIAWRTGDERDFYLPGILYGIVYGLVLLGSAVIRQPLVGWIWSIIAAGGRSEWRQDPRLVRTFTRLTVLWGVVWLAKVGVQAGLYLADMDTALGIARLLLGYPPYALLLVITIWVVRRVNRVPSVPAPLGG
ncbi:DUF3159 domain-containing protein [Micromonospora sp. WMMD1102]|uniref:DUF3159 domain-containing protein n=1 Tax=Micromonospora sp. WMMD1102 TaxID=3016105 RepID=UPI0024154A31|nr:DUF3159 domain-containing protein [Micromonospora sp. WMMD1102]MDG4785841.1 DUF3159 domain-containing protein [Micromonospora sp. WMMD1102]